MFNKDLENWIIVISFEVLMTWLVSIMYIYEDQILISSLIKIDFGLSSSKYKYACITWFTYIRKIKNVGFFPTFDYVISGFKADL